MVSKRLLLFLYPVSLVLGGSLSPCDINQDGTTNVADVQRIVSEALGTTAASHDLNQDGKVNVLDVQIVINAALNLGCPVGPVVTITAFNPNSGPIGTMVTVTGTNFGTAPLVSMPKQGGGAISQPVSSASATSVTFAIAAGTATGPITLNNGTITGNSSAAFTVTPSNTFSLTAGPASANLIQGQSVAYAVQLSSSTGFTGLAALSVTGAPSGVTASLKPPSLTAGQTALLTLTAPAGQALTTANLSITASASVEGIAITQSAPVTLTIVAPTTSFLGRTVVADNLETPLVGATVTTLGQDGGGNLTGCTGHSVVSDAAGNFALTNLPPSCVGPQLIGFNGNTVTSPAGTYAGVNLVFTLVAANVVVSPVLVHMPRSDNLETFMVNQNSNVNQSYAFKSIPGLSVTVYAGTTITAPDGSQPNPYPLAAVEIPIDRLPDAMPLTNSMVTAFIVSFPPANTTTNQPVAVWFPNTLNTQPGTSVVLMTLNPTMGRMVAYGTGTISNDGTTIVPDIDPSTGSLQHRFGISHFDWHGPAVLAPPGISIPCGCDDGQAGDPVDLASGIQTWSSEDLVLSGNRGSLMIQRTFRNGNPQQLAFGAGTGFNYDYRLSASPLGAATVNLQMPNGTAVPFTAQAGGAMVNTTVPDLAGAVLTGASDGSATLRFKTGAYFTFEPVFAIQLTAIGDPNGNVIRILHDPTLSDYGAVTEIDDPVGRKLILTNHVVNGFEVIDSITDQIGRVVKYTYNGAGYLATFTDVLGGITYYNYDSQNRLVSVQDPRGILLFQDTYDPNGRVMTQTSPSGGVTHFAYTLSNPLVPTSPVLQTVVTDPLGNITTYRFNTQGYIVSVTDATGQTRTFTRDPGTNLLTGLSGPGTCDVCGNPEAGDMTFTHDANGNTTSTTDSLGNTWRFTYDPVFNNVTSITDPSGNIATSMYDPQGNLIRTTDARMNTTVYTRDPATGLITAVKDEANAITTLQYNPLGELITVTDPLGIPVQFHYDGASRLSSEMDVYGHISYTNYNAADELTMFQDGNGHILKYQYDIGGYPTVFTDANLGKTTLNYDPAGRIASRTDPLNRVKSYLYDKNDNLTSITNRRNQTATIQYDQLNRPMLETFPDATVQIHYDTNGRLDRVVDSQAGTFDMKFDLVGRLTQRVDANGTINYKRDRNERVMSRQVVGQPEVDYTYDQNGNLKTATMGTASVTRTYDARNAVMTNTRSNGAATTYAFDPVGRLTSLVEKAGGATLFSRAFNYDSTGNISGVSADMGLPLSTPAASANFDAANEVTSSGGTTYTSDLDGNRLTAASAAGATTYTWDSRGRLQSILAPGGTLTSFVYDTGGNMMQQNVTSAGQSTLQRFIWDDAENVVSVEQGQTVTSILDGRHMDDLIAFVENASPVFPLQDQVQSEGAFTNASGAVVGREFYETYGAPTASGTVGQFQYTGRPAVGGGLFYNRARFYDSTTGRFLSEDPLGLEGGSRNLYSYARNSPVGSSDPSGQDVWIEHGTLDQVSGIHQKICVGKFNDAKCYSFGLTGDDGFQGHNPFGGDGVFDRDYTRSNRIVKGEFKRQSPEQDAAMLETLEGITLTHAPYFLIGASCITVAQEAWREIMQNGYLPKTFHPPTLGEDAWKFTKFVARTDYQIVKAIVPFGDALGKVRLPW